MRHNATLIATVAAAIILAAPASALAGGGGGCNQTLGAGEPSTVSMTQSCYGPEVIAAAVGETVTFINADPYPHTVTGAGLQWGSTELLTNGTSLKVAFDQPGVYPYMCVLHAGMAGAVVVSDDASTAGSPVGSSENAAPAASSSATPTQSATPVLIYAAIAATGLAAISVRVFRGRMAH